MPGMPVSNVVCRAPTTRNRLVWPLQSVLKFKERLQGDVRILQYGVATHRLEFDQFRIGRCLRNHPGLDVLSTRADQYRHGQLIDHTREIKLAQRTRHLLGRNASVH